MRISIIVPAYNEETTIDKVLSALLREVPDVFEIIVVDDGSKDNTAPIVEKFCKSCKQIHLIRMPTNMGKTAALKAGFEASSGDIVLIQDADLEYDPVDIPELIKPIVRGNADVVFGSRFITKQISREYYFRHFLANKFLTFLTNLMTGLKLSDVETGYKAFRGEIIRNMIIESHGFGFEIEVTMKIAKLHCRICEIPISYYGRSYEEGKKIGFKDGVQAILYIFKYRLFCGLSRSYKELPRL